MRMGTYYRAELLKSLGLHRSEGRILDIGGYDGFMLSLLDAPEKVSVDIETIPLHPGIRYCLGDGLALPFRDESFDTIYALDVLEHVDSEQSFASELIRVLKPGGRLVLTTPQRDIRIFPGALQRWVNRKWQHYKTPGYSQSDVEDLFEVHKLAQARVSRLSAWWFLTFYLPLSSVWKLAPGFARTVLGRIASMDAPGRGPHGYLLAEVTK
jgi:SAM-dependent methyltransferase